MRAIADHIDSVLSGLGLPAPRIEGASAAQWILMDFGDVVVHVFLSAIRAHYGLEKLWGDARRVRVPAESLTVATLSLPPRRSARVRRRG